MRDANPVSILLKDYKRPAYLIGRTELHFELGEDWTIVTSRLHLLRDSSVAENASLELQGEEMELLSVAIDGIQLEPSAYRVSDESLLIHEVPEQCIVTCQTRIQPQLNTTLSGLYKSRALFCTQCEAEGFRRITYYLDRPDVMSVFTVTVEAERARYPVLLSNGNLSDARELADGRHQAVWHDPFPKPAYLFALVAGDLAHVEDSFTTSGGRRVTLRIYVEEKDIDKCAHAMRSLQESMRWDEQAYGREYDLDIFNIVAVDDFNMGAMENKSLNIFNTSCVLCSPETTTDSGFQRVEAIVAHEYFHNWSGNRVTCRDWFQLSLKEGFTVFRDAQFSADMGSPTVKRVQDATMLRTAQFAEDAGPMAHPVRPESYMEINNFYTLTVYEKGAEVVRMMHTLLGAEQFRRGSDLYFERHDGQAVTCEDFVCAMEDASGVDLRQFRNWYSQAGTPQLAVRDEYDEAAQRYTLHVEQSCPPTPGQPQKQPFVIPLRMGLLGDAGNLPLRLSGCEPDPETSDNTDIVLTVDQPQHSFIFEGVAERPVPSLLRGFSAPVRLHYQYSKEDLCSLIRRDSDGFVRWDSAQALAIQVINEVEKQLLAGKEPTVEALFIDACGDLLLDESLDCALVAEMLRLPSEDYLAELASRNGGANVDTIHQARDTVRGALGAALESSFLARYQGLQNTLPYAPDGGQIASRSLRNICLGYLVAANPQNIQLADEQYRTANNMTDRLAALQEIAFCGDFALREDTLEGFYNDWQHEALVVNQWLQLQAAIPDEQALSRVQALLHHADFDIHNPNKVRALIGGFANHNPVNFHRQDGSGYHFLGDIVIQLNALNPQVAARLLTPLTKWRNYAGRAELMRKELERIAAQPALSPDVFEIVTKSLN
ncbi:Aminopeptidase N [Halioglobus japonicus]|nr:Aminopeptidase N [Halioglobus japonicus]